MSGRFSRIYMLIECVWVLSFLLYGVLINRFFGDFFWFLGI